MSKNDFVLQTYNSGEEIDTLKILAKKLKISVKCFDQEFGIVDVGEKEYCFRIKESCLEKITGKKESLKGPYSNVKIEPFDLEQ